VSRSVLWLGEGLLFEVFAVAVVFDDVVHVLVAASGQIDQDAAGVGGVFAAQANRMGDGMCALERGDEAFHAGEHEEGFDGFLIGGGEVLHAAGILEEGVLGTDGRIVEAGSDGVDRGGFALVVLQHVGIEAVHDAFLAVGHRGGVVADLFTLAEGLDAVDLAGIGQEAAEEANGVGAATDAGGDDVREAAGHIKELFAGFDADDALEVTDHHREGMGADDGADAVELGDGVFHVGAEAGVDSFLEGLESEGDRNDLGTEEFHAGDIGCLLGDIDFAHVDVALEAEVGRGSGEGHAVLAGTGFGDEFLLAQIGGQEAFAHAVVQLVRAGVVEVFAFHVDLGGTEFLGQALAMIDRCGAALVVLANGPELSDEFRGAGNRVIGIPNFIHDDFERGRDVGAAVFAIAAVRIGMEIEVVRIVRCVHMCLRWG